MWMQKERSQVMGTAGTRRWCPLGLGTDQALIPGVMGRTRCSWPCPSIPWCLRPLRARVTGVFPVLPPCRHGLSEAELKDVLSLDDEVLQAVYQDWTPPSRELLRFPPLLWVRLRRDLGNCLARRPVDGFTLLAVAHRWVQCQGHAICVPQSKSSPTRILLGPDPLLSPSPGVKSTWSSIQGFPCPDSNTTNLVFMRRNPIE